MSNTWIRLLYNTALGYIGISVKIQEEGQLRPWLIETCIEFGYLN